MCSPLYEFCLVSHGSPFRGATVYDWIALGKSSESRLVADDNAALYINPLGRLSRGALKYIKIGVDQGMARYAHSGAVYEEYDDVVLRKVPLQIAVVSVDVIACPWRRTRELECRLQGCDVIFSDTYSECENLRAFKLQDNLLTALRSRGRASCNTKIVLIRVGLKTVISPAAFVWDPGKIRPSSDRGWDSSRSPRRSRKPKMSDLA